MEKSVIPPGKIMICRPFITLKNGRKIYAASYGKEAFCFLVDDDKGGKAA